MNNLNDTMHRLASIANELESSGYREESEQITQLMEQVLADVESGNMRLAWDWGNNPLVKNVGNAMGAVAEGAYDIATAPARGAYELGKGAYNAYNDNVAKPVGDYLGNLDYVGSGKAQEDQNNLDSMQTNYTHQVGTKANQALDAAGKAQGAAAAAGQSALTNDQKVLAQKYLSWAKGKGSVGVLNKIYDHASKNQSPQYVNKLMAYLKSQGVS